MTDSVSMANMNPPGKLIYNSRYIHISAITLLPENEIQIAKSALKHLEKEQLDKVSVLRISSESSIVSALNTASTRSSFNIGEHCSQVGKS